MSSMSHEFEVTPRGPIKVKVLGRVQTSWLVLKDDRQEFGVGLRPSSSRSGRMGGKSVSGSVSRSNTKVQSAE